MKILLQNPETSRSQEIECDPTQTILDVLRLSDHGIVNGSSEEKSKIALSTLKEFYQGESDYEQVELKLSDKVGEILTDYMDRIPTIYIKTTEISEKEMYHLRTLRSSFAQYDLDALRSCKIMIAGVGLVGSEMVITLAQAGCTDFYLIDNGSVEWVNTYRQALYDKNDLYDSKVEVAARKLEAYPGVLCKKKVMEVPVFSMHPDKNSVRKSLFELSELIAQCDIILVSIDAASARVVFQILSKCLSKPCVLVGVDLMMGEVIAYTPQQKGCYLCGIDLYNITDHGSCTLAPMQLYRITSAIGAELTMDIAQRSQPRYNNITIGVNDYTIDKQDVGQNDPHCSLCGANSIFDTDKGLDETIGMISDYLVDNSLN